MSGPGARQRSPGGVKTVEIVLYLGAVFQLLAGLVIIVVAAQSGRGNPLETVELLLAGLLIGVGLFHLVLARAIGRGQEWARAVYVGLHLLTLLGGVAAFVDGQERGLLFFLLPLVGILLLFIPSSGQYFAGGGSGGGGSDWSNR